MTFLGASGAYEASLTNQLWLILAAVVCVYIVLGVLYESYIHPLTILSTLPSAGVGALLALMITGQGLGVVGIIGIILLIGIVKKNAIMMIDFAIDAERTEGKSPRDAIHQAALLRFRPILMTTLAALFAAVPLMLGWGEGAELRRPLGLAIFGGLIVSQMLTLFTTPVIYLGFDSLGRRWRQEAPHPNPRPEGCDGRLAPRGRGGAHEPLRAVRPPAGRHRAAHHRHRAGGHRLRFSCWRWRRLPQVDFPVITVSANLPGASPDTMATSVATPLERRLGVIAGVNEITSNSGNGSTRISLQFDLNRKIDAAAREVQAAINASRVDLPSTLRSNPTYRKANPSAAPVVILALTSPTRSPGQIYDAVSNIVQQKISQVAGVGDVELGGGSLPAVRVDLLPFALNRYGVSMEDVRAALQANSANRPKGAIEGRGERLQIYTGSGTIDKARPTAADYRGLVVAWRNGAAIRLADVADVADSVENINTLGLFNGEPAVIVLVTLQPGANAIETVDGVRALLPELEAQLPQDIKLSRSDRSHPLDPHVAARSGAHAADRRRAGGAGGQRVPAQRPRHHHSGGGDGRVAARHFRRHVPAGFLAQQPEPDGADGGHRFRGRRCHRRAGEHQPPHRGRHGSLQGGTARRARGRLHRAVDQPVAGGGVHSAAVHGRAGGPAVPRIRRDAVGGRDDLAGHLADHHADDVRLAAAPRRAPA